MKPWIILPTAFAMAAVGCGGSSSSPAAVPSGPLTSAPTAAPSPTASADALTGTWQTAELPTASYVATYRKAGAPAHAVRQYSAELANSGHDHRYLIRIADGQWVELEQHDNGTPQVGWAGTYTLAGDTVHAVEDQYGCHITYRIATHGSSMRVQLVADEPESPPYCGRQDSWPQRSIYETATFHRVS